MAFLILDTDTLQFHRITRPPLDLLQNIVSELQIHFYLVHQIPTMLTTKIRMQIILRLVHHPHFTWIIMGMIAVMIIITHNYNSSLKIPANHQTIQMNPPFPILPILITLQATSNFVQKSHTLRE